MYGILGLATCYRDASFCNPKTYFIVRMLSFLGQETLLLPPLIIEKEITLSSIIRHKALSSTFPTRVSLNELLPFQILTIGIPFANYFCKALQANYFPLEYSNIL